MSRKIHEIWLTKKSQNGKIPFTCLIWQDFSKSLNWTSLVGNSHTTFTFYRSFIVSVSSDTPLWTNTKSCEEQKEEFGFRMQKCALTSHLGIKATAKTSGPLLFFNLPANPFLHMLLAHMKICILRKCQQKIKDWDQVTIIGNYKWTNTNIFHTVYLHLKTKTSTTKTHSFRATEMGKPLNISLLASIRGIDTRHSWDHLAFCIYATLPRKLDPFPVDHQNAKFL